MSFDQTLMTQWQAGYDKGYEVGRIQAYNGGKLEGVTAGLLMGLLGLMVYWSIPSPRCTKHKSCGCGSSNVVVSGFWW